MIYTQVTLYFTKSQGVAVCSSGDNKQEGTCMNNKKIGALFLALASTASYAGTMGPAVMPEHLLLLEAGLSYSHAFYDGTGVFAESVTAFTPNGFAINHNNFFPNDFFGGYIGASLYMPSNWLLNTRFDMLGEETKYNSLAQTTISLAPVKLSFTVDKVFGNFNAFSMGLGGGAVIESLNDGKFLVAVAPNNPPSESIQGRTRIDPLVEAFAMYRFANNFGVKLNAAYQIPVNAKFGNGDLNLNLGFNYSFAV